MAWLLCWLKRPNTAYSTPTLNSLVGPAGQFFCHNMSLLFLRPVKSLSPDCAKKFVAQNLRNLTTVIFQISNLSASHDLVTAVYSLRQEIVVILPFCFAVE